MSPLMQSIFDQLCEYDLDRYIDAFARDTYAREIAQLHSALSAALPKSYQDILTQYSSTLALRARLETEAMFQAAFAAARELR